MDTLPQPDWSEYLDAERDDATLSGAWRLKGTRIRVQDVMDNAVDQTPEEIAGEVYPSLSIDRVKGVRNELPGHDVKSVQEMGWNGIVNGRLLTLAERPPLT